MKQNIIQIKSFEFAVSIALFCKELVAQREFELARQLLRAGTSIGANVREARNSHSRKEFQYKLTIALRECDETMFWLELLYACKSLDERRFDSLCGTAKEISNILTRIVKTLRENDKKEAPVKGAQ